MQRAESLQPLSRQHKSALMTCLLVRKGISKQAPVAVIADFLWQSWNTDIRPHFEEEEQKLLPALSRHAEGKAMAVTIERDHELLRNAFIRLQQLGLTHSLLGAIADQLEQHVRYEERIVFQRMQDFLTADEIGRFQFLDDQHTPICNTYSNHFWE